MKTLVTNKTINRKASVRIEERCPVASKAVGQVRQALRQKFFGHFADSHLLDLTLNEAESVAWETSFPHLFFPTLAEEKISRALTWGERQRALKAATSELCFAA